jgi:hypothetical protein
MKFTNKYNKYEHYDVKKNVPLYNFILFFILEVKNTNFLSKDINFSYFYINYQFNC